MRIKFQNAFYLLAVFLFSTLSSFAFSPDTGNDSIKVPSVMLIPYDPIYYLSDADHDIAAQSKRDMKEVRNLFRLKSDYYAYAAISKYFKCIDLMHDTANHAREDLITVFSTLGYQYESPMNVNPEARKLIPDGIKKQETQNPATATRYKSIEPDLKYMNAVLGKPALLDVLGEKYGADYFVFLNQFEIKTNYNSCLDIANKIYQRTVLLHFSVYDRTGRQVAGNFAYSFFPSDTSEENEIIRKCFADLGSSISKSLADAVYAGQVKK